MNACLMVLRKCRDLIYPGSINALPGSRHVVYPTCILAKGSHCLEFLGSHTSRYPTLQYIGLRLSLAPKTSTYYSCGQCILCILVFIVLSFEDKGIWTGGSCKDCTNVKYNYQFSYFIGLVIALFINAYLLELYKQINM